VIRRSCLVLALVATAAAPSAARAAFPADPPNDPSYAVAEGHCGQHSVNEEQFYLFSRVSSCTAFASDPEGASGMSVDKAWREVTAGRPDVTIAYVEGGINWHSSSARDLVNQVFLNAGELPAPTTPVADGRLNVRDFADTPDANHNGYVDAEDLIVRFSDGTDADHNGYVDDVSGWDFYDDQNDPASVDGAYDHANDQMRQAAAEADNGIDGAGVCPGCTILPIKAGAEAVDRTDDLAQAWLYAGDVGAKVIVSVTADLGYSTFMRQTVERLWRRGVVMAEASNDFDSTDHQGGMFWPHVLPGNGLVSNSAGIDGPLANLLTSTFRARSGLTSWGTHSMFSVATSGGSTSTSTPTTGGVAALVLSAGGRAAAEGRIAGPLTGPEAIQVMRATASDIAGDTNWPSRPGWDLQFGYGRPNAAKATQAVMAGDVPPVAWLDSPDWYALIDPARTPVVAVRGHVEAPRSSGYRYRLQIAPGPEPAEGDWLEAGSGTGSQPFDGQVGTLDTGRLPAGFAERAMALSQTKTLETNERYTVSLRLQVTDAAGRTGEERRTVAVVHDPSWLPGFPKAIGTGGESQPQLADLAGTGRLAAVFGDSDGAVHAVDGTSGRELPGWPVATRATQVTRTHPGIDPGHEPVVAQVALGDLDGTGRLSVVATSTTGRVYAWDAAGRLRPGWPRALRDGVVAPPIPRPDRPFTRDAVMGAIAAPVLVDVDGDGGLDVAQSGWDGALHVFDRTGRELPGWPVHPQVATPPSDARKRVEDHKLDASPTVADLDGDGRPELVVRFQTLDITAPGIAINPVAYVHAFAADGHEPAGWPAALHGTISYYGSAQEFITEGAHVAASADIDNDGRDEVASAPIFSTTQVLDGHGHTPGQYGPTIFADSIPLDDPAQLADDGNDPGGLGANDLFGSFTASGSFGRVSGRLVYVEPGTGLLSIVGSLLLAGSGQPIVNGLQAWDARTTARLRGHPLTTQGLDFLGGPIQVDVNGDGRTDIVQGGDSSVLQATSAGGAQIAGFPKFTSGWVLFAPSAGDLDGDGATDLVATTREGYLMAWRTKGRGSGNREWWAFRHDERNTSRYGTDSRPPGVPRAPTLSDRTLRFVAPGADWYAGQAPRYSLRFVAPGGQTRTVRLGATAVAGATQELTLPERPAGDGSVRVVALDAAGNRSTPVVVRQGTSAARATRLADRAVRSVE
jgi:FG-GAP-like repeat/Subtilase family